MITREQRDGMSLNIEHCVAFAGSIVGNAKATNGDRVLAALTISIATIGLAYIQNLEIGLIMSAGRN